MRVKKKQQHQNTKKLARKGTVYKTQTVTKNTKHTAKTPILFYNCTRHFIIKINNKKTSKVLELKTIKYLV